MSRLSYACATLLLRLSPRHDEPHRADHPRDVDRARVIMMTLRAGGSSAPTGDGAYADCVSDLEQIWESAVVAHAAPSEANAARQEVEGPPPEEDWLDNFTADAINHFREFTIIRPYNEERWRNSQVWFDTLQQDQSVGPLWSPEEHVVPDVLTAAWRLRLTSAQEPNGVAAEVQRRWSSRRKGG